MKNTSNRNKLRTIFTDEMDYEWYLCIDTGELKPKGRIKHPDFSEKYYGLDTKTIEDCRTEDQLVEVVSLLDGYLKNAKVLVDDTYLTESILEGHLTRQELAVVRYVAKRVCAWNIFIGTKQEIINLGVDPKSLARVLRGIDKFIKVLETDVPYKGCIKLTVNPLVAWKGDDRWLETITHRWYRSYTEEFCAKMRILGV